MIDGQEPSVLQQAKSEAMIPLSPRPPTHPSASLHDAKAREAYSSRFRPSAIAAVAAGTRCAAPALGEKSEDKPSRPAGVLRDEFDDRLL
jgi:hypothetical protein